MRNFNLSILVLTAMFTNIKYGKAQIPVNDPAWIKDTTLSDDFGGTTLKTYKWWADDSVPGKGLEMMFNRPNHPNVTVSGGHLRIKVDTLNPNRTYGSTTYQYQSGDVNSNDTSFKYGYLEISAKYPTGNEAYWPAFWLWGNDSPSPCTWYNEIDICENGPAESLDGHKMGTGYSVSTDTCSNPMWPPAQIIGNLPLLSSAFHKYALEWAPDRMLYYFDDSLVRSVYDATGVGIPQHHLHLVFDIFVTSWVSLPHMPADSLVIDYFNYYTLNTDCNTNKTICTPSTDYYSATPARAVEKTITAGGVSCTPTFNTSDKCTLRATDAVTLDAGTTINPDGSGQFSIIVEPCPQ